MGQDDQTQRSRIEAEAAQWLARLEAGDADVAVFEAWRSADPAHAAAFAQLDAAWSRLGRVRALRPVGAPDPDLLAPQEEVRPSRRWLLQAAGFGGALILAGGVGLALTGRAYAETGVGERRAVRLPDGSLIDLNTNSRASWRVSDTERKVWLERGEAAFEVAGAERAPPFVLSAARREVTLERGVFNARLIGDEAEIVPLRPETTTAAAAPPPQAIIVSGASERLQPISAAAVDAAGAWRRGEIVFNGDTLADAVSEYNRYRSQPIEIDGTDIAELRMGGRFTTHDPEEFLAAARTAFGIRAEHLPDGRIRLSRPND